MPDRDRFGRLTGTAPNQNFRGGGVDLKSVGRSAWKHRKEIGTVATGAIGLFSRLKQSRHQKLAEEVLDEHLGFRNELTRYSRGQFTPSDIRRIREADRKNLDHVAGDIAQRGLGGSGAGIQTLVEAQQLSFLKVQDAATQALSGANEAAFNMTKAMSGSDSFNEDFAKVVGNLKELHGLGQKVNEDSVIADMFQWLKDQWESMNESVDPSEDMTDSEEPGSPDPTESKYQR